MRSLKAVQVLLLVGLLCGVAPAANAQRPQPPGVATAGSPNAGGWSLFLPLVSIQVPPSVPGFGYGVEVDRSDSAAANVDRIHDLGFGWTKMQMAWKDVEPNPGDYRWAGWDATIAAYSAGGLSVLLTVTKAPNWARPANTDLAFDGPPADPQTYANFVAALTARYKGKVRAIEVWNEQNVWFEWGHEPLDAGRYVTLLCKAYAAIKSVDASVAVVSGAPTATGLNDGSTGVDDQVYVQRMYDAGAKGCFDGLGAHPSGYNNPPDATVGYTDPAEPTFKSHRSFFFRGTMEGYRATMVANGDAGRRIWATSFGWASDPAPMSGYDYARDNTLEEQAAYSVRAYELAKSWGWAGPMILWNLDFGITLPNTELAYFSLLRPGPMPAFGALAAMPK